MVLSLRRKAKHVLGQNARSLQFARNHSPKAANIAQDKLATKKLLQKAGLPTPRLHALFRSNQELVKFRWTKLPTSFVIKPKSALGGSGILVIFGRNKKGNWVKADKSEVFIPELRKHILNILDGNFSTSNIPDTALIEQRVKNHPDLKSYSLQGIPDIRVIVYNSIPVMAMLRLSTIESQGRANLHAGGIGVGLDLARGITTSAIYHRKFIDQLPNSHLNLSGIHIPHWPSILLNSVKAARALALPFAGVDLAIDRDDGPLILEVNAHPGLDIQLANLTPLHSRLKQVEDILVSSPTKGVQIGTNLFGGDIEQEIEDMSGQTILGIFEPVTLINNQGVQKKLSAKIDSGAWRTTIDTAIAKQLNLDAKIIRKNEVRSATGRQIRPVVSVTFILHDKEIKTEAFITDRSTLKYSMIIGRRDLKGFLIDPCKNARGTNEDVRHTLQ